MRISDWRSDVCSSDLLSGGGARPSRPLAARRKRTAAARLMLKQVRAWARSHTERDRYSPVGIAFHWVMAFLVPFQLGWGWYASRMPVGGDTLYAYQVTSAAWLPVLLLHLGPVACRWVLPGPV